MTTTTDQQHHGRELEDFTTHRNTFGLAPGSEQGWLRGGGQGHQFEFLCQFRSELVELDIFVKLSVKFESDPDRVACRGWTQPGRP